MPTSSAADNAPADSHEAHIAALRARRYARLRWLALRSGLALLVLLVMVALLAYWLLMTIGGRDALLTQIQQRLPETAKLEWSRAEGPVAGPMTVHDVRLRYEMTDKDGHRDPAHPRILVFTARRIVLDPALRPLLGRRLRLDALQVEGATLEVPESDEPFELPRWPESLPDIRPPMSLQADDVRVDGLRITSGRVPVIDIRRLRGGLDAQPGLLHVEHLGAVTDHGVFALHGDYEPRENYRMDLVATAVLPAPAGRTPPRLGLVARGDLAALQVALAGHAPAPLRATVSLRGGDRPDWRLVARSDGLDPALLLAGEPGDTTWSGRLHAQGVGGAADVQGEIVQGSLGPSGTPQDDQVITVLPSKLRLENQVVQAQPLALRVLGGTLTVRGRADFTPRDKRQAFEDPDRASLWLAINARGLTWGGDPAATPPATATPQVRADADLGVAGTVQAWAAIGRATLTRDGQQARVTLDGRGDLEHMQLRRLHAAMPTGALDAQGDVRWAPALGWDLQATLAGFDPGYFAPDWDGALRGTLRSQGHTRSDGGLDLAVDAPDISGRLRGRALQGRGKLRMQGAPPTQPQADARFDGEVALTLGGSRVDAKGSIASALDIDATFAPLQLEDLLPNAAGRLRGTLSIKGPRNAPDIDADLDGGGLRWGDYRADVLRAQGRLPWRRGQGSLRVTATGLALGLPLDALEVDARGAVEDLRLDAKARSPLGAITLAGDARRNGATWQGTLAALHLQPVKGAAWQLQQASRFRWDGRSGALSSACLAADGGGSLCASAEWPRRGLDVRGQALPLTLLLPYLPERSDDRPWFIRGEVALEGQLRPLGNGWRGTARLTSAGGGIRNSARSRTEFIRYGNLVLSTGFDPQRLTAQLDASLNDDGRVSARLDTGWDEYAPLAGEFALDTDEITWLELFSPDIVEPKGRLEGNIRLAGTRAQPLLGGHAQLTGFSTEVPALAITLQDGEMRLDAQPDGSARISGHVRSGEGTLQADGTLGWRGQDTPLVLSLRGQDVLVSDTRDLHAVAAPDIQVRYAVGQPFQLTGTVTVPEARIDLERLDEGVATSPDVVVLDPADPQRAAATPLDLDLTLALGDAVALSGFGLDGLLSGRLHVRQRPGREMIANGQLDVEGRYTAYGQKLEITRGELVWTNGPVDDPILNIRAEREVGEVTAGVDVRGRASSPQARVWSSPESSQSEAMSYLALGRPLSSVSSDENRQINAANAALSAGGSMLASQLGARIGLDEAGVMDSRALGGSVFGVGKYFSPRLYVGYGVSLLGTGQVLTLKYLLRKGFDIEIESSTVENRASVNWRKEK